MRRLLCSLAVLSVICWAALAGAQYVPITGTGYDQNIVVGVGETYGSPPLTATMDGGTSVGGNTWYQLGQNTGDLTTGLPMGQTFVAETAADHTFAFQGVGVGAKNAMLMASDGLGATTETFSLTEVAVYDSLSFLASSGNGAGTIGVTLNYAGGSSYSSTFTAGDWFGNTNVAYTANGRINGGGYDQVGSGNPKLYYYDLTGLPTASNILQSITLTFESGSNKNTHTAIMGVSGIGTPVSSVIWTGNTNNVWSLAGSDTNWSSPSQAYSDGMAVAFDNTGISRDISIASEVRPLIAIFENSSVSYSFSGAAIAGTGSVVLGTSAGSVAFNSPNTYTGSTTINGGTLQLGDTNAVQNSTVAVNATNGLAFAAGVGTCNLGGLAGSADFALNDQAGTPAPVGIIVGSNSASTAYSGAMSGSGSLTKVGNGMLTLTGTNSYSGGTTITAGTLQIGNGAVNGTSGTGSYSIAGNATLKINALSMVGMAGTAVEPPWANITGAGTLDLKVTNMSDWAGAPQGGQNYPNMSSGFTGTLHIESGRIPTQGPGSLGGTTAVVVDNGGQLGMWNGGTFNQNFTIAGTGWGEGDYNSALRLGSSVLTGSVTLSANATIASEGNAHLSGVISGPGTANLSIGTNGQQGTILFTNNNTYSGGTTINKGTLAVTEAAPGGTPLGTGTVTLAGGVLSLRGLQNSVASPLTTLTGWNAAVIAASGASGPSFGTNADVDGSGFIFYEAGSPGGPQGLPSSGLLVNAGGLAFQLQSYTANNALRLGGGSSGTLTLTTPGPYAQLHIADLGGTGSPSYSFTLHFADGSSTTVAGQNAPDWFGGTPYIASGFGRAQIQKDGTLLYQNTGDNPRIYENDYTLSPTDAVKTLQSVTFDNTSNTSGGTPILDVFAITANSTPENQSYPNNVSVTANSTLDVQGTLNATMGTLAIGNNTLTVTGAGRATLGATTLSGSATFSPATNVTLALGAIGDNSGGYSLTMAGSGTLLLTGSNTYGGGTTITAGTLQLGDGTAGHDGSIAGDILNDAALVYNLNGSQSYAGAISGGGSLTKTGTGMLTLSGNNTYGGGTTVSDGTLVLASPAAIQDGTSLTVGADAASIFGTAVAGANSSAAPALVAVPEPGTLVLLLAGLAVGFGVWKKRGMRG